MRKILVLVIYIIITYMVSLSDCLATEDVNICESMLRVRARLARIKSPNFPDPVAARQQCQCNISSTNTMDIMVKFLLGLQPHNDSSLCVNYERGGHQGSWPTLGNTGGLTLSKDNKLVMATNVTFAEVVFKTGGATGAVTIFELVVKADDQHELSLNCTDTTTDRPDSEPSDTEPNSGVLHVLDQVCSPYLVIVLGGLSAAFLLIILIVSIILCCVYPRKRKGFMDVIRRSRNLTEDTKTRNKKESFIYDEAFRRSQATYLDPDKLYNDATLPAANVRHSGPHYMNSALTQHQAQYNNSVDTQHQQAQYTNSADTLQQAQYQYNSEDTQPAQYNNV